MDFNFILQVAIGVWVYQFVSFLLMLVFKNLFFEKKYITEIKVEAINKTIDDYFNDDGDDGLKGVV